MNQTPRSRLLDIRAARFGCAILLLVASLGWSRAFAQTTCNPTASSSSAAGQSVSPAQTFATFQAEQQSLAASFQQLVARGATQDQIAAWKQQNAARLTAQQQRGHGIVASQPSTPMPYVTDVDIPADASQTLQDFLSQRAELYNARAQIHNQQLQNTGMVDEGQVETQFQAENSSALQAQAERAKALADENDSQPLPVPPPLVVPAGAGVALQQFLTLRDQLIRGEIQVHNQNLNLSLAERQAAVQKWRQQNSPNFQQLQTFAQKLFAPQQN
jgi:hypothetical protein